MTALHILVTENLNNDELFIQSNNHRKRNDPAWIHLNWIEAEKWLSNLVVEEAECNISSICRLACFLFINENKILKKLAGKGRENLRTVLSDNEIQVFRSAKLLENMPEMEVVSWWDYFKELDRGINNKKNLEQGRLAESWTMKHETFFVNQFNLDLKPLWIALESDSYGYDIISFRKDQNKEPHKILIEVKSFISPTSPIIFITRNEWQKAVESTPNYLFIVWCIELQTYKSYTSNDFLKDIPSDVGRGKWHVIKLHLSEWNY